MAFVAQLAVLKPFGNHNRSWIWGRNAVLATLRAGRWMPLELAVSDRCPDVVREELHSLATARQIPFSLVTDDELSRRCRAEDHQGLAARMPEFPYAVLDDALQQLPRPTAWLVLDGIQDSFNFGAIVRSAVELGIDAILIGTTGQSPVNSQAVRSSAGAVNSVPIVRASNLPAAVDRLLTTDCVAIAASEKAEQTLDAVDLTRPVALVIGNEGRGVSNELLGRCRERVRIPSSNQVGSLNAAVAAGILCYELVRQRTSKVASACR